MTVDRLTAIQMYLQTELGSVQDNYTSWVNHAQANDKRNYYYWGQIVETAREFDYNPNPAVHKAWGSLKIRMEGTFELVVRLLKQQGNLTITQILQCIRRGAV
jgi:hypothetical protein